jgi:hypothetical protein
MSYYGRGDYYRGDYYRGDPGIFSFLGGIAKAVLPSIPIIGPIAGAIFNPAVAGTSVTRFVPQSMGTAIGKVVQAAVPGRFPPLPQVPGPGGAMIRPPGGPIVPMGGGGGGGGMRVMRPSGKGFYTARHLRALAQGRTRAKPRMNPFNPSALRRAARRAHSFLRMSRKLVRYYVAKPHKGKAYIAHRKKSK